MLIKIVMRILHIDTGEKRIFALKRSFISESERTTSKIHELNDKIKRTTAYKISQCVKNV